MKNMFISIAFWLFVLVLFMGIGYLFEQYTFVMQRLLMFFVGAVIFFTWAFSWKDSEDTYGLFLATPVALFCLPMMIGAVVMIYNYIYQ